jgi:hypothetical protein
MSTASQLMAAGRKLDAAEQRRNAAVERGPRDGDEAKTASRDYDAALAEYRRILEDITGQHADVILRRLS